MTLLETLAWLFLALFAFWGFCLSYMSRFKHRDLPPGERTLDLTWRKKP